MSLSPTSIADVRARLQNVLLSIDNTLYSGGLSTHHFDDPNIDSALGTTPRSSIQGEEDLSYYTPLPGPGAARPSASGAANATATTANGLAGRVSTAPPPSRTAGAAAGRLNSSLTGSAAAADTRDGATSPSKRVTFSVPPPLRPAPSAHQSEGLHKSPPLSVAALLAEPRAAERSRGGAVPAPAVIPTDTTVKAEELEEAKKASSPPPPATAASGPPSAAGPTAVPSVELSTQPKPRQETPAIVAAPAPAVSLQQKTEIESPALPSPSLSERLSFLNEDTTTTTTFKAKSGAAWRPTVPVQVPAAASALHRPAPRPESEEGDKGYGGTLRYTDPNHVTIQVDKHLRYNDGNDTIDDAFQSLQQHFAAKPSLKQQTHHHHHHHHDYRDAAHEPSLEEANMGRRQPTAAVDRSSDFVKSPPRVPLNPSATRLAGQLEMEEAEYMLSVLRQRRASHEALLRESRQVDVVRRPAPSPPRYFPSHVLPTDGGRSSDYALTTTGRQRSVSPHTAHDELVLATDASRFGECVAAAATGEAERLMRRRLAQQREQQALRRSETERSRADAEAELQSLYREAQAMRDRQDRLREGGLLARGEALQREVAAECVVRPPSPAELTSIREHAYELERLRALYEGRVERSHHLPEVALPEATVLESRPLFPGEGVAEPSPSSDSLDIPEPRQPIIVQRRTPVVPAAASDRFSTPERARPLKRKARKLQPAPPTEEEEATDEEGEEEGEDDESGNESLSDSTVGGAPRADEHTHLPPQPMARSAPTPAVLPTPQVVAPPPSSGRASPSAVPLLQTTDNMGARGCTPNSVASSVLSERLHVSPTRRGRFTVDGNRDRDRSSDDDDDENSETIWADGDDAGAVFAARKAKSGAAKNLYGDLGRAPSARSSKSTARGSFIPTRSRADPEKIANHEALQAALAEVTMLQAVNKLKQKGVAVDVKLAGRRIPARLTLSADETELLFEVDRLVPKAAPPQPQQQKKMPPQPQTMPPRKMMPPPQQMMLMTGGGRPGPYPAPYPGGPYAGGPYPGPQRMVRPPQDLIRTKSLPPGVRPVPLPANMTPLLQHNIPIVAGNRVAWLSAHDPFVQRSLPPPPYGPSVSRTNSPASTRPPSSGAPSRSPSAGARKPSPQSAPAAAPAKVETVQVRESHHFPVRNARAYMPFAVMGNERELGDGGPHTWEDVGGVLCGPAACELLRCYRCTIFAEMRAPTYCSYRVFVLVPETQRGELPKEAVLLVLDFRSRVDLITFLLGFQQVKGGRPLTYGRVLWLLATQRLQRARSFLGLNPFDMECILRGVPVPLGGRSPTASRAQSPAASRDPSAVLGYRSGSPLNRAKNKIKGLFSLRRHGEYASPSRRERVATTRVQKPTRGAPPAAQEGEEDNDDEEVQTQHAVEEKPSRSSRFGILRRFSRSISGSRSRKEQSPRLEEVNANTSNSKKKAGGRFVLPD